MSGRAAGFSLAETAAALFLGLLISAAVLILLSAVQRAEARFQGDAQRAAALRRGAQRICSVVRHAGVGSGNPPPAFAPLVDAGPQSLTILRDLDGDGLALGGGERICFHLDGDVLRQESAPVAEGVVSMTFTYQVAAGVDGLRDWEDNDGDGLVDQRGELRWTDAPVSREGDGRDNDGDGEIDEEDESETRYVRVVEVTLTGHGPLGGSGQAARREVRAAAALLCGLR